MVEQSILRLIDKCTRLLAFNTGMVDIRAIKDIACGVLGLTTQEYDTREYLAKREEYERKIEGELSELAQMPDAGSGVV